MSSPAADPGTDGWMFFRDNLWRGRVNDEAHVRDLATDALGVPVVSVEYRAFETDEEYLAALEDAIADDLDEFRAGSVSEVLSKYFGSSIEVQSGD
ncbi:LWR-salt protein [Halobacteriaceae archaeon GCM10025711]